MNAMIERRKGEDFVRDNITPKSQADRIRAMSDEELAEWINNITDCCYGNYCEGCPFNGNGCSKEKLIDWLKSEAKE